MHVSIHSSGISPGRSTAGSRCRSIHRASIVAQPRAPRAPDRIVAARRPRELAPIARTDRCRPSSSAWRSRSRRRRRRSGTAALRPCPAPRPMRRDTPGRAGRCDPVVDDADLAANEIECRRATDRPRTPDRAGPGPSTDRDRAGPRRAARASCRPRRAARRRAAAPRAVGRPARSPTFMHQWLP